MNLLDLFLDYLIGNFNNKEQYDEMLSKNILYPYAEHINTICNKDIINLPDNFKGKFMIEESYYTVNGRKTSSTHLFLLEEVDNKIKLSSYDVDNLKKNFTHEDFKNIDYSSIKESTKFVPAFYEYKDNVFKGGSVSMFTNVLRFSLYEEFSKDYLKVSEIMDVNGKKTFGYDEPIIYKKVK